MPAVPVVAAVLLQYKLCSLAAPFINYYPPKMELTPFTIEEAVEICEDFEDLIDTEFKIGSSPMLLVAQVAITPFHETDKNRFAESYYQTKNSENALSFYKGSNYDVLLMIYQVDDETNYSYIDIRTFVNLKGIKYSFPL